MPKRAPVPGKAEWEGYEQDLDARDAHKLFFGKRTNEVLEHFAGGRSIERASDLSFMPRKAFQFYVMAFVEYLITPTTAGDCDAASSFLRLLLHREELDPGSVFEIYPKLTAAVDFVSENQKFFDAPEDIYGRFPDIASEIREKYKEYAKSNA